MRCADYIAHLQQRMIDRNRLFPVYVDGSAAEANLAVNGAGDIDASGLKVAGKVSKRAAGIASIKI